MDQSVPPGRVRGICIPPCSKSYAQRALAASLLAEGTSRLHNIEFCDDTRSAIRCIEALGARVRRTGERTLEIDGGLSPAGDKLYVGQSGLSTRLFTPIASLCDTPIGVVGEGPLLHRSFRTMIRTLRALGVRVHDRNDHLPLHIQGPIRGRRGSGRGAGFLPVHHRTAAGPADRRRGDDDSRSPRNIDPLYRHHDRHGRALRHRNPA